MNLEKIPIRYIPKNLSYKDTKLQHNLLEKSKKLYKKHKFYTRKQKKYIKSILYLHQKNYRKKQVVLLNLFRKL